MAKRKRTKREQLGFKQSFEYVLDVLCFAYYVKHKNLISDHTFDELEKLYAKMFDEDTAPMRAMERAFLYSTGVQVVYDELIKRKKLIGRKK